MLSEKIVIGENETAGELHDRMKETGAELLLNTIKAFADGSLKETAQADLMADKKAEIKHAPKIFTETCTINWNKSTSEVYNLIRGLSPYPAAFTTLEGKKLKIFTAEKNLNNHSSTPGTFETDKKTYLRFACNDGYISVLSVQLEGKKRMDIKDFLRGYHFA